MADNLNVNTRLATADDVDKLFEMIRESTGGKTRIELSSLRENLFSSSRLTPEVQNVDPCIEFDIGKLATNVPAAQVILAEVDHKVAGYLLYRYHYSPWSGHSAYIEDVYVDPKHRKRGILKRLIQEIQRRGREDDLKMLLFSKSRMPKSLFEYAQKFKLDTYRDENTDWRVYRFKY